MRFFLFITTLLFLNTAIAESNVLNIQFKDLPSESIQGPHISFQDLKGKIILVDFWASWCEPCKEALPHYNNLYKKYKDRGLVVIGINEDDDIKERDAFLKKHPAIFPMFFDKSKNLVKDFKVQALPSLYVFDKNLKPVKMYRGFSNEKIKSLEKTIIELL